MSIGSRIAEKRKALNMTQQDLAEKLDVTFQAVSSWERDETLPDTAKLKDIANALSEKVSWLFEEEGVETSRWELRDAMFSVEHMEKKVVEYARIKELKQTLVAVKLMKKYHAGQVRKGNDKLPYIIHPLMIACHAIALGIGDDNLLSACLLHDVLEDCDATPEDLNMSPEVTEAVKLVSFEIIEGLSKEESKAIYYEKISKNQLASMVKLLDRCNNISTMATGFKRIKIAEYIDETEKYILPLLDIVKHEYYDYYNATFLLKYQMLSVIESLKRTL